MEKQDKEPKKPYKAPQLIVHGTIQAITQNVGTKNADGITGSSVG